MKRLLLCCLTALPLLAFGQKQPEYPKPVSEAQQWLDKGVQSLFDKTKLDYQMECFNNAIKADPKLADAYRYRAGAFHRAEKPADAVKDYGKFIELYSKDPKHSKFILAKAYFNRGDSQEKLKKYKEALADYKKAAEIFPKEESYQQAADRVAALAKAAPVKGGAKPKGK